MYILDIVSEYELLHGFTEQIMHHPLQLPSDVLDAQYILETKRRLARILRLKSLKQSAATAGGLVEVYVKRAYSKRGSSSPPRVVVSVDNESCSVTVLRSHDHSMKVFLRTLVQD